MKFLLSFLITVVLFVLVFGPKSFLKYYLYSEKMRKLYLKYSQNGFDNFNALKKISKSRHPELSDPIHEKLASKFDEFGALISFIYFVIEGPKQEFTDENALALIEASKIVLQGRKYRVMIDRNKILSTQKKDKI